MLWPHPMVNIVQKSSIVAKAFLMPLKQSKLPIHTIYPQVAGNPQNYNYSKDNKVICRYVALAHLRMARQGEVIPRKGYELRRKLNKCIGTFFSCRARGSNPGPPDIVILQWPLHHLHTASCQDIYLYCAYISTLHFWWNEWSFKKHTCPPRTFFFFNGGLTHATA